MISVCMAFRETGDGSRTALFDVIYELYAEHLPEVQLCIGTDDGSDPFHKTMALNRAVEQAQHDILLITDTDTWVRPEQIWSMYRLMGEGASTWGRPWHMKVKINEEQTKEVMLHPEVLNDLRWQEQIMTQYRVLENNNTYWAAPPTMLRRSHYETVGGLDERFRGWGQEDEAFCLSLRSLVGRPSRVIGYAVHLWHPRIGKSGKDAWPGESGESQNLELIREYRKRSVKPLQMRALIDGRNEGS